MTPLSKREKILALCASLLAFLFVGVVWWVNRGERHTPASFLVQIEGAVRNPGVYEVPEGTRLFELLERAGGARDNADLRGLNLVAPLYDGQKITIPAFPEKTQVQVASSVSPSGMSLVNVNTASQEELQSLPGIGEVIAQRIIEYRETHGPFQAPEDLLKVKGIGPKKLETLRDRITF